MESAEIEVLIDELEQRVDRLRALYEQYFMGIEKIEPQVLRKDVDRRLWILRREQIRNTALRFKLNMIVQRYNTFQQYWQRINREIEAGTYKRDVRRVATRFGTDVLTAAARRRFGKQLERAGVEEKSRHEDSSADDIDVELEELDSMGDPTPGRLGDSDQDEEFGTLQLEDELLSASSQIAQAQEQSDPFGSLDDVFGEEAVAPLPAPPRPPRIAAPFPPPTQLPVPPSTQPARDAAPAAASSAAPRRTEPAPPPDFGNLESVPERRSQPGPGAAAACGEAVEGQSQPGQRAATPPMLTRRRQSVGPVPFNRPASNSTPGSQRQAPPSEPRQRPLPSSVRLPPLVASNATAGPVSTPRDPHKVPSQSSQEPRRKVDSAEGDIPQVRVRQIYESYVQARRACKESTSNITESGLAEMLRASAAKLRSKHGDRSIDFDVVIKDGKAILKPVVKSR